MRRDRCCCGAIDVKIGAQILSVLYAIGSILNLIALIWADEPTGVLVPNIILQLAALACCVLAIVAVMKRKAFLILPMVIIAGLGVIIMFICFVLSVVAIFAASSPIADYFYDFVTDDPDLYRDLNDAGLSIADFVQICAIVAAVLFGLCILLGIWYFFVYFDCFRHLRDLECHHTTYHQEHAATTTTAYYN